MSIHISQPSQPLKGDAQASDVRAGKTFENASGLHTGNLTDRGAVVITPSTVNQAIPAGIHNGSGVVQGDGHLAAGNIVEGVTIFGVAGTATPASPPTGTAAPAQVLSPYTFMSGQQAGETTGTMADNGGVTITPGATDQTIAQGYHDGTGKVSGVTVDASKVLTGTTIAGTAGTMPNNGATGGTLSSPGSVSIPAGYTSGGTVTANYIKASGNANAAQVLSGYTATNASGAFSGSMSNQGAVTITPSASSQTIPQGYHNGSGSVAAVSFDKTKVLTGTTIAGTAGTMPNYGYATITPDGSDHYLSAGYYSGGHVLPIPSTYKQYASGSVTSSSSQIYFTLFNSTAYAGYTVTVSGLSFTPSTIVVTGDTNNGAFAIYTSGSYLYRSVYVVGSDGFAQAGKLYTTIDGTSCYINGSGFRLPFERSATALTWYAYS